MAGRRHRHDERGLATVAAIGLLAVLVLVAAVCVGGTALVLAHRRAQVAADLAALAGASALQRGADPCAAAGTIAERQDARLARCVVDGADVVVETGVRVVAALGGAELPARARAGPVRW
jgi:secretion/DNA translocation related TadE-like protein